jgi:hypothetical protein
MVRTPLLIFVFAATLFGGAWWIQTRAAADAECHGADESAPPVPAPTRKLDEYGDISWNDEKARLDNFAIEMHNLPVSAGYLICYGGRVGRAGAARRRCQRAGGYVSGYRGIDAARVVTVDGGYREELTVELWVVPPGATPPQPSPTVAPGEVRFVRGKAKRRTRTNR